MDSKGKSGWRRVTFACKKINEVKYSLQSKNIHTAVSLSCTFKNVHLKL